MEIFGMMSNTENKEFIHAYKMSKHGLSNQIMWTKCKNYNEIMIFIKT